MPAVETRETFAPRLTNVRTSHGQSKPRILCVDDDRNVLEGLRLHLEGSYAVEFAIGGKEALEKLASSEPFAVVISDMRMPGMDGVTFLARVHEDFSDSVRILLTGQADLKVAAAAVNQGKIFHFLTKPCPPDRLLAAVRQAVEHYQLVISERVLLDQTLRGAIQVLTDVLALTHPVAFGRAMRIRRMAAEMSTALNIPNDWQVDVAAMLSQIGCLSLDPETVERLHHGSALSPEERQQVNEVPLVAARLLGNIPRLETVRAILGGAWEERRTNVSEAVRTGSQLLRIASDYDVLEAQGLPLDSALSIMRSREGRYQPDILDAFAEIRGSTVRTQEIREISLRSIKPGMILLEDLFINGKTLLAARGYEVTQRFVERAQNWRRGAVNEPIRVIVPPPVA